MGKYRASLIHEWWSDWHYHNHKVKRRAYMTDIDRLWVELRKRKGIVAVLELKWKWAVEFEVDALTVTENIIMQFFEKHGIPFYVLVIDPLKEKPSFHIHRPQISEEELAHFSEEEMIEWINQDYDPQMLKEIIKLHEVM